MQSNFLRVSNKTFSELPRALLQKTTTKKNSTAFTRSRSISMGYGKSIPINLIGCSRTNLLSTSSRQILPASISLAPIKSYHDDAYVGKITEVPRIDWVHKKFLDTINEGEFLSPYSWKIKKFSPWYRCNEEIKDTSDIKKIIPSFCLQPFNNNSKLKEEALNIEKSISAYRLKYFNEYYEQMVRQSHVNSLVSLYENPIFFEDSNTGDKKRVFHKDSNMYTEYAGGVSLSVKESSKNNFIIFGTLITLDSLFRENMQISKSDCYIPFMLQKSNFIRNISVSNSWTTLIRNLSDIEIEIFINGMNMIEYQKDELVKYRSISQIKEMLIRMLTVSQQNSLG